jgi:hypothetical protein
MTATDLGLESLRELGSMIGGVLSGVTSLNVSVCDCDLSRTGESLVRSNMTFGNLNASVSTTSVLFRTLVGVSCAGFRMTVSQDGRRMTVVSSSSVCDERMVSALCFPEGVKYCSCILRSS